MIVSNVDIGSGPGINDGESLYSAFNKVNHNFANVVSNVNSLTNSVTTVAGRTGNVVLTVNDILGLSNAYAIASSTATANTAMRGYVDATVAANIAALINGAPGALNTLEELAAALGNNANYAATITNSLATLNSNITIANTSMKGYVDGQISAVNAAVILANSIQSQQIVTVSTTANLGIIGYIDQANTIQSAQVGAANLAITAANVGMKGYVDQGNSIQASAIIAANLGIIGYIDLANTIQSGQVGAANLAIIAANLGMKGYVDSVATLSIYSNVNVKAYTETMGFQNFSNVNVAAYLSSVSGNIIPTGNAVYSLGSITNQWRHLYVSSNTIYIGGNPITVSNGSITVNGNSTSGSNLTTYSGNIAGAALDLTGATGPVGNIAVLNAGNGFTPLTGYTTSGGSGSGFLIYYSLAYNPPFTIYAAGSGYRVGDIITIINDPGNTKSNATAVVTSLQNVAPPQITVGNSAYKFGSDGTFTLPTNSTIITSNISGPATGNLSVSTPVIVTGNITANYFVGNGSQLTGLPSSYSNVQVATYLPTYTGNITAGNVSTTGIVKTGVYTASTLPTASSVGAGARAFITDANTTTFGSAFTTGGANAVPVFSNGTTWRVG